MNAEPLYLVVDGSFFLHRILHLPAFQVLTTQEGMPTGGVFGVVNNIRTALKEFPTINQCFVVWDRARSRRRQEILPEYKANRDLAEDADPHIRKEKEEYNKLFNSQKALLEEGLQTLGVRQLALNGREADDVIGWMVYNRPEVPKVIVTEDKDLLQFVYEFVSVYQPIKKITVTDEHFYELIGVLRPLFLLRKALTGDKSDNIPGVPKVGDTVADRLMDKASEIYLDDSSKRLSQLLTEACDVQMDADKRNRKKYIAIKEDVENEDSIVRRNLDLIDIRRELSTFTDEDNAELSRQMNIQPVSFNEASFLPFAQKLEFNSVVSNWSAWSARFRSLI